MQRWYFDTAKLECTKMTYGGCKGNRNNFNSNSQCKISCEVYVTPAMRAELNEPEIWARSLVAAPDDRASDSACKETAFVKGPCEAGMTRYSWNSKTRYCEKFTYGGCDGSENNFRSMRKCERACKHLGYIDVEEEETNNSVMLYDAVGTGNEEEESEGTEGNEQLDIVTNT